MEGRRVLQTWDQLNHLGVVADAAEIQVFPDQGFRNSDLVKKFELSGQVPWEEEKVRAVLASMDYFDSSYPPIRATKLAHENSSHRRYF